LASSHIYKSISSGIKIKANLPFERYGILTAMVYEAILDRVLFVSAIWLSLCPL